MNTSNNLILNIKIKLLLHDMNIIFVLFALLNKLSYNKFLNNINKKLHLPTWHNPSLKCNLDKDCPVPYACCHDAFFPTKDKFCCLNYKKREYEYEYAYIKYNAN
jgi:hypothetical protein